MAARYALLFTSLILLLLAPAISCAQGSLDITLPTSYHISSTSAYDENNTAVGIRGGIDLINYGNGVYATISTDAPDGTKLIYFQDPSTRTVFRNNTLLLPLGDGQDPIAGLVLSTDDLTCANGTFSGPVTGIELDTKAIDSGDAMASAILYLSKWPDRPEYRFSATDDAQVKKAVADAANKDGVVGNIKLMLNVSGDSISYVIVRMKAPEASGNVSAFRYSDGSVTSLTCKEIRSNDSVIYETISTGGGTFAFVGPFPEAPPMRAGMESILLFAGALALSLAFLVALAIKSLKWLTKNE